MFKVKKEVCGHCGKQNAECVELGFIWKWKYYLCQSCVSQSFRSFRKDK